MEIENQQVLFSNIEQDNPKGKGRSEEDECNIIHEILSEILIERKVSVVELARELKVPYTTIDDWLKGRSVPLAGKNLLNLFIFSKVPLEYLCFGIGDKNHYEKYEQLLGFFEFCLKEIGSEKSIEKIKEKLFETHHSIEEMGERVEFEEGESVGSGRFKREDSQFYG